MLELFISTVLISVAIMSAGNFIKKLPFVQPTWFALSFAVAFIVNISFFSVSCVDNVFLLNVNSAIEYGAS